MTRWIALTPLLFVLAPASVRGQSSPPPARAAHAEDEEEEEEEGREPRKKRKEAPPPTALSVAASLAFDAATWARMEVSTASPARDIAFMQGRGYYKQELFQMILLAVRSGKRMDKLMQARENGARLRELSEKHGLDYDAVYDDGLALQNRVEETILPRVLRVWDSPPWPSSGRPPSEAPGPPRGAAEPAASDAKPGATGRPK